MPAALVTNDLNVTLAVPIEHLDLDSGAATACLQSQSIAVRRPSLRVLLCGVYSQARDVEKTWARVPMDVLRVITGFAWYRPETVARDIRKAWG